MQSGPGNKCSASHVGNRQVASALFSGQGKLSHCGQCSSACFMQRRLPEGTQARAVSTQKLRYQDTRAP